MVEKRITDGTRIAELLASEITGLETGVLSDMDVVEANPDVEPTDDGAFAYGVDVDDQRLAAVFVLPDCARLEPERGQDASVDAAEREGLRVTPADDAAETAAGRRSVVFLESGAAVKGAVAVLAAAGEATVDETE